MLLSIYADCIAPDNVQLDLERHADAQGEFYSLLLRLDGGMPVFRLDHLSPALLAALGGQIRQALAGKGVEGG